MGVLDAAIGIDRLLFRILLDSCFINSVCCVWCIYAQHMTAYTVVLPTNMSKKQKNNTK